MRKKWVLAALTIASICFAGCANEETPKETVEYEMKFVNQTGQSASQLQLRPIEEQNWTENLLQEEAWENGFEVPVSISGSVPVTDGWQVRLTFTNDTEQIWENVPLGDNKTFTFSLDDGTPVLQESETTPNDNETTETSETTQSDEMATTE